MFSVSFNDVVLKTIKPTSYALQAETIKFPVNKTVDGKVRFCSVGGENNSEGAILKSVSLFKVSDLENNSIQPAPSVPNQPSVSPQNLPGLTLDSHSGKCLQK